MEIKKVFIMAYARKNLGDDLFVKMLLDRSPDIQFYIKIQNDSFLEVLDKYENLTILEGQDTDEELYNTNPEEYDAYVYIGGSIFMEGGKVYNLSEKMYDFIKRCREKDIPFCYISSNYGPYKTQEYFELSKKTFNTCTDICFRDKYSYDLFKDCKSVRYAPDYAFCYEMGEIETIPNSVGISVIDLEIRDKIKHKSDEYIQFLKNNIEKYLEDNKKVYLFSFCKHEGDEETVDKIKNYFKENDNVIPVKYDGDVDNFLEHYKKMEYMICSRFHAMILSSVCEQKIYVISYSDKIDNVIKDLKLDFPIAHFEEISENIVISKDKFVKPNSEKVEKIIESAKMQEMVFKEFINM